MDYKFSIPNLNASDFEDTKSILETFDCFIQRVLPLMAME